jgi:hypothetical protein
VRSFGVAERATPAFDQLEHGVHGDRAESGFGDFVDFGHHRAGGAADLARCVDLVALAGAVRFRWVNAPTGAELTALAQRFAQRVGRYLERQGLLQRGAQTSYLAGEAAGASRSLLMTRSGLVL